MAPCTGLRVGTALAACVAMGLYAPRFGRLVTPFVALVVAVAFLGVLQLLATGELTKVDRDLVKALRSRSRGRTSASDAPTWPR